MSNEITTIEEQPQKPLQGHLPAPPPLIPYRKGDKWGFCTPEKKIVIALKYDEVLPFLERVTAVRIGERWGFIDQMGREVVPPKYDFVFVAYAWRNFKGLFAVWVGNKAGLIDQMGQEVVPP
ncbi:MAG: WG repeat-containing protein, partial [Bacteroidia bacterium]|nr:WG repeat-containing protein [Bacteroidia bacterium]